MSPTGTVLVLGLVFGRQPARVLQRFFGRFDGVRGGQSDLALFAFWEVLFAVELRRALPHRHCARHFAWRVLEACANASEHLYLLVYSYVGRVRVRQRYGRQSFDSKSQLRQTVPSAVSFEMPGSPASSFFQTVDTPVPRGVTAPNPVTTTRLRLMLDCVQAELVGK